MFPFIAKKNGSITVFAHGQIYTVDPTHANYSAVKNCIQHGLTDELLDYLKLSTSIAKWSHGSVSIVENKGGFEVTMKGTPVHSSLASRMLTMFAEGFDVTPLSLFMENVARNPSEVSRNELYDFLEHCDLPITEDGHFLAYKMVRKDYTDIRTGTFHNAVGDEPEMPRMEVDDNRMRTCSIGLHVCSLEYIKNGNYGSQTGGDRVMVVDVDPANVVSFPMDYNFSKGRVWKYKVIGELEWNETIPKNFIDPTSLENDKIWDAEDESDDTCFPDVPADYLNSDIWAILDILALENHPPLKKIGEEYGISARQVARIRDREGPYGDRTSLRGKIVQMWHDENDL